MKIERIALLDDLLDAHAGVLGGDLVSHRNHAYRAANLCLALARPESDGTDKIAIAGALHDMGIWTDRTFDYLEPSVRLAAAYLARTGRIDWTDEISEMIRQHHKISPYRDKAEWLVEPFRRADWIDVSRGLVMFGLKRRFLSELYATWPGAGFHRRLVQLEFNHLRRHPLNPLPMFRL